MGVGGDDDTVAGSLPSFSGVVTPVGEAELIAGRYRIMRWLGGGGMGRVYEALDTELGERVALKVVKAGLSDDALERFRREVKLTRRIQHTNVARMFDIGEHAGERFLTMELIDGEPLTRKMGDTPMPWPQLKAIAEQLCAGLTAAHAAGVVHRDLKPDNVLIERGTDRVVLTDFGIARSGDDPSVTQIGAVVGTPRYMAPEQLAGIEVDTRADLFSLGVMLFELATATRPWPGDNAISIAVAQATSAPRSMDMVSAAIPPYFTGIVAACLQLDPKDRPASAAEIAAALAEGRVVGGGRDVATKLAHPGALQRPRTPSTAPRAKATVPATTATSLAVMPITCAPADEYLADGLLEDLTDTLSTTPAIRVRPAGVTRQAPATDARELGRTLQVDVVVVGSLRRTAAGLRISTRLVSVADGFQIWAHRTDCSEADVLTVADELAHGIAEALSTHATSDTRPTDPRAVDLYLRARAELRRFWGSHALAASALLEQAVEYAPTSPAILGAAAFAAVQAWVMRSDVDLLPKADAAVQRALTTGHGEAYLASGQFHLQRGDIERGGADLGRALVRAPMSAQTHELAARILLEIEGPAQARMHYDTAIRLDPGRTQIIENELARVDALEQRWPEAEARLAPLLTDSDPSLQQLAYITQARLTAWRGDMKLLMESSRFFAQRVSRNLSGIANLITVIQGQGKLDRETWNAIMPPHPEPDRPVRQFLIRLQIFCEIALSVGEHELALETLERLATAGLIDRTWLEKCPLMTPIVESARYAAAHKIVSDRAARVLAAIRSHAP